MAQAGEPEAANSLPLRRLQMIVAMSERSLCAEFGSGKEHGTRHISCDRRAKNEKWHPFKLGSKGLLKSLAALLVWIFAARHLLVFRWQSVSIELVLEEMLKI
jgi:hypothetical protein